MDGWALLIVMCDASMCNNRSHVDIYDQVFINNDEVSVSEGPYRKTVPLR